MGFPVFRTSSAVSRPPPRPQPPSPRAVKVQCPVMSTIRDLSIAAHWGYIASAALFMSAV